MTDSTPEKVIKGLDCCIEGLCEYCPYVNSAPGGCKDKLMVDALSALQYVCCGECRWSERFDEGMRCKLLNIEVYDKFYCAVGEQR